MPDAGAIWTDPAWRASALTWLPFAIGFYLVGAALFRVRTGRWPYAYPNLLHPYALLDQALGAALTAYSVWVVLVPPHDAPGDAGTVLLWSGLVLMVAGGALRTWGLASLGRSWRMGQDPADDGVRHVRGGAFRLVAHPLNVALIIVGAGQTLLRVGDPGAIALTLFAIAYWLIQGVSEERHWRARA